MIKNRIKILICLLFVSGQLFANTDKAIAYLKKAAYFTGATACGYLGYKAAIQANQHRKWMRSQDVFGLRGEEVIKNEELLKCCAYSTYTVATLYCGYKLLKEAFATKVKK